MANGDLVDVYKRINDNAKAIGDIQGDIKAMNTEIHHLQENGRSLTASVERLHDKSSSEDMALWKRVSMNAGIASIVSTLVTSTLVGVAIWFFRGLVEKG